jgi:hypothetical protein
VHVVSRRATAVKLRVKSGSEVPARFPKDVEIQHRFGITSEAFNHRDPLHGSRDRDHGSTTAMTGIRLPTRRRIPQDSKRNARRPAAVGTAAGFFLLPLGGVCIRAQARRPVWARGQALAGLLSSSGRWQQAHPFGAGGLPERGCREGHPDTVEHG